MWDVFHGALEVETAQRNEYLSQVCGSDTELRAKVSELLASHELPSILDSSPLLTSLPQSDPVQPSDQLAGPTTGDILANRFEIIRLLGRGGMARVYEAIDLDLGARVALKMLRNEISSDPESLERFNREVNLARRVTHPNVCGTFDLFHHGNLLQSLLDQSR